MTQLTDDCFAFGGELLSYAAAVVALRNAAPRHLKTQILPLHQLRGRVLAQALTAQRAVPAFDNSAVDGYAFAHGQAGALAISAHVPAGASAIDALLPGQAARVLTGAPIPPGADTVLMDEDAAPDAGRLTVPPTLKRGANLRSAGEDIGLNETLYPAGHMLSGLDIARVAAAGIARAQVSAPLHIQIISSGDELKNGQVVDANRWLVEAIFAGPAFHLEFAGLIGDDLAETKAALTATSADLILTSGGVSVGERDMLRTALEEMGELAFWRVGIKPGRPVAFGTVKSTPILALPGNPVACFVTAQFLALPFAHAMLGAAPTPPNLSVTFAQPYRKKSGRTEFVRVHVDAEQQARPYAVAGAGILSSLTQCDGVAILGPDLTQIEVGAKVPFLPFHGLLT